MTCARVGRAYLGSLGRRVRDVTCVRLRDAQPFFFVRFSDGVLVRCRYDFLNHIAVCFVYRYVI
jgi:hypothetical protein